MNLKEKLLSKPFGPLAAVLGAVLALVFVLRIFHSAPQVQLVKSPEPSPLYEPGDKPTTVFLKAIDVESGKVFNWGVTIYQSKSRANQMKQSILAYLGGPRKGKIQVPVPEGLSLNEFYLTPTGVAVADLSTAKVQKLHVGFYEESLFIRGLIETLTGNFFEVKQVKILVEGQDQPTLLGHYALNTSEANMPVSENANFKF